MRAHLISALSKKDSLIYPLNHFFKYHLYKKNYPYLKSFASNNPSESLTIETYKNLLSSISSSELARSLDHFSYLDADSLNYVFIGSKNSFVATFKDFVPSAFNNMYSFLLENGHIKHLGTGLGCATIISSSLYHSSFDNYSAYIEDPSDLLANLGHYLVSVSRSMKNLKEDNEYYLSVIEEKDNHIALLTQFAQQLQNKLDQSYQMTWR